MQGDEFLVLIESDLQSNDLKPVVGGHKVNGVAVCIGVSVSLITSIVDIAYLTCCRLCTLTWRSRVRKRC